MRVLPCLWLLIGPLVGLLAGQAVSQDQPKQSEEPAYAETPEALRPYRGLGQAYWQYYTDVTPFRGPRKDTAPHQCEAPRIGLIAPIGEGPDREVGLELQRGVTLAFEEANAAGGFRRGTPYELIERADAGLWGASSNTLVELAYQEQVVAVIGSVDATSTHVALRAALKAELPMVNTACSDPTLTETAIPWLLRTYPDDRQYGYRLARFLFQERDHRRVAVLRSNDKYGRMGIGEFTDAARRLGCPVVVEQRYYPGAKSFEEQIEVIRKANVDALVLWSNAQDGAHIARAVRAAGLEQVICGSERLVSPSFLAEAGHDAEGVVSPTPMPPDRQDAIWLEFSKRYSARFGEPPGFFAAYSYDGARMLIEILEQVGLNRALVRDALARVTEYHGVSGAMKFDPTHNNLGQIHIVEVRDGRHVKIAGP